MSRIFNWGQSGDYWSLTSGAELGVIGHAGSAQIKVADSAIEVHSFDKSSYMSVGRGAKFTARCIRGAVTDAYINRWVTALQDKNDEVRWNALVNRLDPIYGPEAKKALPAIKKLLDDPNEQIRAAAKGVVQRLESR